MSTNTSGKRSKTQGATPLILSPADIENEGNILKLKGNISQCIRI
jgi:hypothetical protein